MRHRAARFHRYWEAWGAFEVIVSPSDPPSPSATYIEALRHQRREAT